MKKIKLLIPAVVIISILAALFSPVAAIDENETINDSTGDVIDLNKEDVITEHPDINVDDIDIVRLTYNREDTSATLTLKVQGNIGNRGAEGDFIWFGFDPNIPEDETSFNLNLDTIAYTFVLETSADLYSILYINQSCRLINESFYEPVNISDDDFSVSGDTLTITFELDSSDETYESVSVQAQYMKLQIDFSNWDEDTTDIDSLEEMMTLLTDEAPNQPLQTLSQVTNLGEVGKEVQFEGFAIYGQPPYTYEWDFGDGSSSTEKNTTHVYDEADVYNYTLTVTDGSGQSMSDSGSIEIIDTDENNDTPGFEFVLLIAVFALIVLWKRK